MATLTVRQAAERLGIGYSTLKHWIYRGSVRTTRTAGGHHRIAEAEVERLLARTDGPPARARRSAAGGGVLVRISGPATASRASSTRCGARASSPRSASASATSG